MMVVMAMVMVLVLVFVEVAIVGIKSPQAALSVLNR